MIPEIKRFHSPDIDDLDVFTPTEIDNFCFLLQLIASPKGMDGEESFDIIICTPLWLAENIKESEPIIGRHHLIVKYYDYNLIMNMIKEYCTTCIGTNWNECATKLGRIGKWEFEDYQE